MHMHLFYLDYKWYNNIGGIFMKKVVVLLLTLLCITGCGKEYVESSEYISVNK